MSEKSDEDQDISTRIKELENEDDDDDDDSEDNNFDISEFAKAAITQPIKKEIIDDVSLDEFHSEVAQYGRVTFWDSRYLEDLEPFEVR